MKKSNKNNIFRVGITANYFQAVAKQKLAMQNALAELVDNAVSNCLGLAHILVAVLSVEGANDLIRFVVADWGNGMNAEGLRNALQFGSAHKKEGYLCMYGVGLCNCLLVGTQNKYDWVIASKKPDEDAYHLVHGPFALEMEMEESAEIPFSEVVMQPEYALYGKPSTIVSFVADKRTASTMLNKKGNACPSRVTSLNVLRRALAEHFGVMYRGFLQNSRFNGKAAMDILLPEFRHKSGKVENVFVQPIEPPIEVMAREESEMNDIVKIGKYDVPIYAKFGILNPTRLATLVMGEYPTQFYYLPKEETQGMDIQLGRRTVATAQLDSIWPLSRHNQYNLWSGYIVVDVEAAGAPRGLLNTLANKSDIDVNDAGWQAVIDCIRSHKEMSPRQIHVDTLATYIEKKADILKETQTGHEIYTKYPVYANRSQVDIVDVAPDGTCEIYNFVSKAGTMAMLNDLILCWDGMVAQGIQPTKATLCVRKCGPMLKHSMGNMNVYMQKMRLEDVQKAFEMNDKSFFEALRSYNLEVVEDDTMPV